MIKKCRSCYSNKIVKVGGLGDIAISDFTDQPQFGPKYPLNLVYCEECTLLQLDSTTPRELLYKSYWYESRLNPVIVNDLKEIAKLCKGSVISIGENDGTLLQNVKGKIKIAVDPSNIIPKGATTFFNGYWENYYSDSKVDTIVAIACLYDLPDPNEFIRNITKYLNPKGIFISQLMTLQPMIENNDIGNICHEHIEYYSYKSLVNLFERHGLEIFKVEKNNVNGGSYRIFARHFKKGSIDFKEKEYTAEDIKDFFKRVEANKNAFMNWVNSWNSDEKVYGYGASTKGGIITQYYGATPKAVVDVNDRKTGKYAFGDSLVIDKIPDDCDYLWVFPWGFIDFFRKKEKNYKGKWVTTIPEFKIYD